MMHQSPGVLRQVLCGFGVYIPRHKNSSYATHTGMFEADRALGDKRAPAEEK